MKSWRTRLLALLGVVAMLLAIAGGPAMAQDLDDGFWWGDLWCERIAPGLILCSDGNIYAEVDDDFFDAAFVDADFVGDDFGFESVAEAFEEGFEEGFDLGEDVGEAEAEAEEDDDDDDDDFDDGVVDVDF